YLAELQVGNTCPGVTHGYLHAGFSNQPRLNVELTSTSSDIGHGVHPIRRKIYYYLLQMDSIAAYGQSLLYAVRADANVPLSCLRRENMESIRNSLIEIKRLQI